MTPVIDELITLRDWLRYAVSRFTAAGLFFGHGCDNAVDEAAWLILATLHLPRGELDPFLDARLTRTERQSLHHVIELRVAKRLPAAYLLNEAWLGEFRFYVDQRVIVPRSYFAELISEGFSPWVEDPGAVASALDLCTGSGCLAILMASAFPQASVDAVDLSADALAVARRNVADYRLEDRLELIAADLFDGIEGRRYDLIVSNPPYVAEGDPHLAHLRHEPALALAAGADGLACLRAIVAGAPAHLQPGGRLIVEHGHDQASAVRELFRAAGFGSIGTERDLAGIERVTFGAMA